MSKRNPCIVSVVIKKSAPLPKWVDESSVVPTCTSCGRIVMPSMAPAGICSTCAQNDMYQVGADVINKPADLKISQMLRMALEKGFYSEKIDHTNTTSRYMCLALKRCMVEAELITLEQALDVLEYIEGLIFPNDVLSGYMLNQLGYFPTWEERVAFWYETIAVLESKGE